LTAYPPRCGESKMSFRDALTRTYDVTKALEENADTVIADFARGSHDFVETARKKYGDDYVDKQMFEMYDNNVILGKCGGTIPAGVMIREMAMQIAMLREGAAKRVARAAKATATKAAKAAVVKPKA